MDPLIFPVLGNSRIIALVLIIHVFASVIAIGSLTLGVIFEWTARRKSDEGLLDFSRRISGFMSDFMKINGVLGVVIIVLLIGLWGAFSELLYSALFWAFVSEGVCFLCLMTFSIVYNRTWDSKKPGWHIFTGTLSAIFAILTGFLINGIWAFMLNPGKWLQTKTRLDAFMNPVLIESFLHLLIPCFLNTALAIFVWTWFKQKQDGPKKTHYEKLNILSARTGATLIFLQPLSGLSFFLKIKSTSGILKDPTPYKQIIGGTASVFFYSMLTLAGIALTCSAAYWILGHKKGKEALLGTALAVALAFPMGAYTREKARKPYLVHSYMTMNMRNPESKNPVEAEPSVSGETIYRKWRCSSCHELQGKGGSVGPELDDIDQDYNKEELTKFLKDPGDDMPAFDGSEKELDLLTEYLLGSKKQILP